MSQTTDVNLPVWVPKRKQPKRAFYHGHVDNKSFEHALRVFSAKGSRFKATQGSPRAGREFMLKLATDRYAVVRNYDDFPHSLEFSLEIDDHDEWKKPVAYLFDLQLVLVPLGLSMPDKSNDGALDWR